MIKLEDPPVQEKKARKPRSASGASTTILPAATTRRVTRSATKALSGLEFEPTRQEIAERAYHLYLERGLTEGNPEADWLQAERELREEKTKSPRPKRTTGRSRG